VSPKPKKKPTAIPGGGTGANSAYQFRTDDGYKSIAEMDPTPRVHRSVTPAGLTYGATPNYDGANRQGTGTSIFDPVLCELVYRWFCPPGGLVLDPFAGGSVRGIMASMLGRRYTGVELRAEQVEANRQQWDDMASTCVLEPVSDPEALTPVHQRAGVWLKRDDLFIVNGAPGGKVRTCLALARAGQRGLVTAGSRSSPQVHIVSRIAQHLGIPARCHAPEGELGPELVAAQAAGGEIIQHKAGYNNVIIKRAEDDAAALGWTEIPFGMECEEAVTQTRRQVANVPEGVQRIVMPAGSGMSLCGVLWGLRDAGRTIPVVAVQVGADPTERLARYAPPGWERMVTIVPSGTAYDDPASVTEFSGVTLDPYYEAKCLPWLQEGDLFWIVGIRQTMQVPDRATASGAAPTWIIGDSQDIGTLVADEADLVFSCPPYADLEVYSDDPRDLSTMDYPEFIEIYGRIIEAAVARLKPNRFACFVVGEVRGPDGFYRGLVPDTIRAFEAAGARYYNEAILVTAVGSLPVRVSIPFVGSRKMGKTHQNVLVFCKGDPRLAAEAIGVVEVGDPGEPDGAEEAPADERPEA